MHVEEFKKKKKSNRTYVNKGFKRSAARGGKKTTFENETIKRSLSGTSTHQGSIRRVGYEFKSRWHEDAAIRDRESEQNRPCSLGGRRTLFVPVSVTASLANRVHLWAQVCGRVQLVAVEGIGRWPNWGEYKPPPPQQTNITRKSTHYRGIWYNTYC